MQLNCTKESDWHHQVRVTTLSVHITECYVIDILLWEIVQEMKYFTEMLIQIIST
jgi:hypothetical protein